MDKEKMRKIGITPSLTTAGSYTELEINSKPNS